MWVKICGTTNFADAEASMEAGADALGFVFAPSLRQISVSEVAAITGQLPVCVEKIGVFVDPLYADVVDAVEQGGLTGVQLHSACDPDLAFALRTRFAMRPRFRLLQVLHLEPDESLSTEILQERLADVTFDGLLVDSRTAKAQGGTGVAFNWREARDAFAGAARKKLIVAGGLSPENVAEAIELLRPWGVDVVTGVERFPGQKDSAKLAAFVQFARASALRPEAVS